MSLSLRRSPIVMRWVLLSLLDWKETGELHMLGLPKSIMSAGVILIACAGAGMANLGVVVPSALLPQGEGALGPIELTTRSVLWHWRRKP